jgi:uncharacterized protein
LPSFSASKNLCALVKVFIIKLKFMNRIVIPIAGMHCKSCEISIEDKIKKVAHVSKVSVSHVKGKAKIWFENQKPAMQDLNQAVDEAGYSIAQNAQQQKQHWISRNIDTYFFLGCAAAILALVYAFAASTGLANLANAITGQSIGMSAVIGLVAGLSSCMALIGGLVLALSANHAEAHPEATRAQKFRPHLFFNLGRILGFAVFGGLIGLIGGAVQPSFRIMAILALVVGAVMVLLGLKLIEVFPILDKINITLPKFISRRFHISSNSEYNHRGAFVGGAMTFFLPCGFTQAMQLYAISTGSFINGALIMSLFAAGTAVGLIGIGGLTSVFQNKAKLFFATAGLAVIVLGVVNINNASRIVFAGLGGSSSNSSAIVTSTEEQKLKAEFWARPNPDMEPYNFVVKANQPVRMEVLAHTDGVGCMSTIMIPGLYNSPQYFQKDKTVTMKFTPKKPGVYNITCAMGVKRGEIRVE